MKPSHENIGTYGRLGGLKHYTKTNQISSDGNISKPYSGDALFESRPGKFNYEYFLCDFSEGNSFC